MNDSVDYGARQLNAFAAELSHDAPCGFLVTDLKERVLYANLTLGRWLNRDPAEIEGGASIKHILTLESHLYYQTQVAPMIQLQGFAREIFCNLQVQDRVDPIPVLMNAVLRKPEKDMPERIDYAFFDATERVQFEYQLRAARDEAEELAAIVRSAKVGIIRCDKQGLVKRLNGAAATMLGVDTRNVPKKPIDQLLKLDSEKVDWFSDAMRTIGETGADHSFEASRDNTHYNISVAEIANQEEPFGSIDYSLILRDVSQRVHSERRVNLLVRELQHRIGNVFAVIMGLVRQTIRNSSSDRDKLIERMMSLSASHNILTENLWRDADIREIFTQVAAQAGDNQKILVSGPEILLSPRQFKALAMAIHELTTNARKYGALSADTGVVEIDWSPIGQRGDEFELVWRESGGPTVAIPAKSGFGTVMIEQVLAAELGGSVEVLYRPDGLVFVCRAPLSSLVEGKGAAAEHDPS